MIFEFAPYSLNWGEVDPARHSFDAAAAAQVVHSLSPAQHVPNRPGISVTDISVTDPAMSAWSHGEATLWADAMSHALAEGDFGGRPVGNWCC
ncbi:hypothetical protein GCM10010214_02240 [Streptomyces abikoensis]|nr:hypothetical protein GCM10010214_02240 [Streptomyces abikoensis]